MDSSTIVLVAVIVIVALAAVFVFTASARRDRSAATGTKQADDRALVTSGAPATTGRELERAVAVERRGDSGLAEPGGPPAVRAPMDPEVLAVTRRQFLNRSIVNFFGLGLAGFGAASIGFLWPTLSGGFGSKIRAGSVGEILGDIAAKREPFYLPEARSYIVPYPPEALSKAQAAYSGGVLEGMQEGVAALYQKCVHLGCRVPWCKSAQWFECPCHGSRYNRVGEYKDGPAPRGLDRFPVEVTGGVVFVDTGELIQGPVTGTNTTGQEAEGPHCA
ncbi:MAG TPA: Rieske 2Fe-2S domain-containing protein [Acidimicrobiales bacterium]|nr:Rieske 2Fe-2S domain-containing protein [Acidimicrobiales bacterium]